MDTDAKNQTAIQIAGSTSVTYDYQPGWSPTGVSICLTQTGPGTIPDSIKAIDVSVNAKGVPVGSNLRTIVGLPNQSSRLNNPFWSSTSSMGKIAYSTRDGGTGSLWVVSQSGGTPTKILSVDTGWVHYKYPMGTPTWNPDDSKLAVFRAAYNGGTYSSTILIFNTSTWACEDSIVVTGQIYGIEWSRSGINKLVFGLYLSGGNHLYYCDPTTGATPSTQSVVGYYPTWSPDNSSIIYSNGLSSIDKVLPFTVSTSVVNSAPYAFMKWKR